MGAKFQIECASDHGSVLHRPRATCPSWDFLRSPARGLQVAFRRLPGFGPSSRGPHAQPDPAVRSLGHARTNHRTRRAPAEGRGEGAAVQARHGASPGSSGRSTSRDHLHFNDASDMPVLVCERTTRSSSIAMNLALPRERGRVPPPRAGGVHETQAPRRRHRGLGKRRVCRRARRGLTASSADGPPRSGGCPCDQLTVRPRHTGAASAPHRGADHVFFAEVSRLTAARTLHADRTITFDASLAVRKALTAMWFAKKVLHSSRARESHVESVTPPRSAADASKLLSALAFHGPLSEEQRGRTGALSGGGEPLLGVEADDDHRRRHRDGTAGSRWPAAARPFLREAFRPSSPTRGVRGWPRPSVQNAASAVIVG